MKFAKFLRTLFYRTPQVAASEVMNWEIFLSELRLNERKSKFTLFYKERDNENLPLNF